MPKARAHHCDGIVVVKLSWPADGTRSACLFRDFGTSRWQLMRQHNTSAVLRKGPPRSGRAAEAEK
jgi:hypothetical protein